MGQAVVHLVVAQRHHVRRQQVHDFNGGDALKLAVDQGAAEHVARDGVDDVLLLVADLVDIPGQAGNTADQLLIHLLGKKVAVQIIGVQDRELFQVFHLSCSLFYRSQWIFNIGTADTTMATPQRLFCHWPDSKPLRGTRRHAQPDAFAGICLRQTASLLGPPVLQAFAGICLRQTASLLGPPVLQWRPPKGGRHCGAGGRTRTGTGSLPGDFKSPVSTVPPHRRTDILYHELQFSSTKKDRRRSICLLCFKFSRSRRAGERSDGLS